MNILVTFDDNYLDIAMNMLLSLKRYNDNLVIHILYDNLTEKGINKLKEFNVKNNIGEFKFYQYNIEDKEVSVIKTNYITKSCYLRLFAPFIIEDVDRLLYLDPDIICQGSLQELYDMDLEHYVLGACENMLITRLEYLREQMLERLCLPLDAKYVNSGVLLIDLKNYKDNLSITQLNNILRDYSEYFEYHDQDAINYAFYKKIKFIDNTYNYQINAVDLDKEDINKIMIHYSEAIKPWKEDYPSVKKAIPYYNFLKYIGEDNLMNKLKLTHTSNETSSYIDRIINEQN